MSKLVGRIFLPKKRSHRIGMNNTPRVETPGVDRYALCGEVVSTIDLSKQQDAA